MRTIILAGGKGTRLREKTEFIPKPLVEIGSRAILYHIIDQYVEYGFDEFDVACGYKAHMIHRYIQDNPYNDIEIACHDTGIESETADRVTIVNPKETFMITYGDGVTNLNIKELYRLHQKKNRDGRKTMATISGARARSKWGLIDYVQAQDNSNDHIVRKFIEKPYLDSHINCGYWVVEPELVSEIKKGESTEQWMARMVQKHLVKVYLHDGFWYGMDTYKDYEVLEDLWQKHHTWNIKINTNDQVYNFDDSTNWTILGNALVCTYE